MSFVIGAKPPAGGRDVNNKTKTTGHSRWLSCLGQILQLGVTQPCKDVQTNKQDEPCHNNKSSATWGHIDLITQDRKRAPPLSLPSVCALNTGEQS